MQGVIRFVLASLVVVAHLMEGIQYTQHFGVFAVFGFYVLSGYLITLVINDVYWTNHIAFWTNRFLRLFPVYWVICGLTLCLLLWLPGAVAFKETWKLESDIAPADVITNVLIFPHAFWGGNFRLVPPVWSVAVELVLYFALWAAVARHISLALLVLCLAAGYHAFSLINGGEWPERYAPYYAAALPFALGSLDYHCRSHIDRMGDQFATMAFWGILVAWILNLLLTGPLGPLGSSTFDLFFYLNLLSLVGLTAVMSHRAYRARATGWRKFLGDLAYSVFLVHWQVGFVVHTLLLTESRRGLDLLLVSLPATYLVAAALTFIVDRAVEPVRDQVRTRTSAPGRQTRKQSA